MEYEFGGTSMPAGCTMRCYVTVKMLPIIQTYCVALSCTYHIFLGKCMHDGKIPLGTFLYCWSSVLKSIQLIKAV